MLIAGAGPIGLVLAQLAESSGARHTVVVEPNAYRRGMAESLGAMAFPADEHVVDRCLAEAPDRGGFDVGFDCSGASGALETVLRSLRREATAVCVGVPKHPQPLDITRYLIKQGLTLKAASAARSGRPGTCLPHWCPAAGSTWTRWSRTAWGFADFQDALDVQTGDAGKVLLIAESL